MEQKRESTISTATSSPRAVMDLVSSFFIKNISLLWSATEETPPLLWQRMRNSTARREASSSGNNFPFAGT